VIQRISSNLLVVVFEKVERPGWICQLGSYHADGDNLPALVVTAATGMVYEKCKV
jgi:hypothetical protein